MHIRKVTMPRLTRQDFERLLESLGRLDDIGHVGMDLVRDICEIYRNYGYKTQVLAASIRNPLHVIDAAKAGVHVATMPFNVLEMLMKHPLTDIGLKKFLDDWNKLGEKI